MDNQPNANFTEANGCSKHKDKFYDTKNKQRHIKQSRSIKFYNTKTHYYYYF